MTATIKLTDGTTEIELTDNTNYGVLSWSPAVAQRGHRNDRGAIYPDVVEEMEIWIEGSNSTNFLDKVNDLIALLDQAVRWAGGENVDAVTINYTPATGGTEYKAAIVDVPDSVLQWPNLFALSAAATFRTEGVLRFTRRGAWLGAEESDSTTASIEAGELATHNFSSGGNLDLPSPMDYRIGEFSNPNGETVPRGFLLVNAHDMILILEGEDSPSAGSDVNESSNFARGDFVRRISTSAGSVSYTSSSGGFDFSSGDPLGDAESYIVFIVARSSASDTEWEINIRLETNVSDSADYPRSRPITFNETVPTALCLGAITSPVREVAGLGVEVSRLSGSGSIDIDYVVISDPNHPEFGVLQFGTESSIATGNADLVILHNLLERRNPEVYIGRDPSGVDINKMPFSYRGNAILPSKGQEQDVVLIFTGGDTSGDYWRPVDNSALLNDLTLTATRRPAYLVPR